VVAGSEQADALRAMAAFVVETLKAETRPTGYLPIVLRDGRWERFEPAAPDLAPIRELAVRQAVMDYDMQTPLLEAFFADRGEDVFVAPLEVGTQDNGEPQTWTTWAQGVPARLPRADWVGLAAKDERAMFRRWRDIEAVCGRFVEAPGFHPARFSPPAWPDGSGWRRLAREFDHPEWFYAGEPAG
jgi:hypothetical protein